MKKIKGNVTSPKGFKAAGDFVGLKKEKKDMAIIESDVLCTASGCFTTNRVKAAPVLWDMEIINNPVKGIVVNSGNANACTGEKGLKDTEKTAEIFAELSGCEKNNVIVCSTGVIGVNLPMDKITEGIKHIYPQLDYTFEKGEDAAQAILTTDTFSKTVCCRIEIDEKIVTIGGMAKGSGMINPNMATMLCFITTDVKISKNMLDKALSECVSDTFNMISVDGDTSTNDTVVVLANGLAGNSEINSEGENFEIFKAALFEVNKAFAMSCARDGEGATKFIEARVNGAASKDDAKKIALSVVSSNLLKAAIFGEDANWGRALCAMGYSGGEFNPDAVSIYFASEKGKIQLMDSGTPLIFDEEKASEILSAHDIVIDIYLSEGTDSALAWGCDLTYDYVKINGGYRS